MNLSDEQLARVARTTEMLQQEQRSVDALEAELKAHKQRLQELETQTLPDLMTELGLEGVTLKDGSSVTVKPFVAAHISKEHEDAAFAWLESHGYGDIIKERTIVSIHPSTLKAWAKERVEAGDEIPDDLFGIFIGRKAVVKSKA